MSESYMRGAGQRRRKNLYPPGNIVLSLTSQYKSKGAGKRGPCTQLRLWHGIRVPDSFVGNLPPSEIHVVQTYCWRSVSTHRCVTEMIHSPDTSYSTKLRRNLVHASCTTNGTHDMTRRAIPRSCSYHIQLLAIRERSPWTRSMMRRAHVMNN